MTKIMHIMSKEIFSVTPESAITEAAKLITSKSVSMLVVQSNEKPVAVISEMDVINGILNKKTKVKDIMSRNFRIISPYTKFHELRKMMKSSGINRFAVVDNDRLVGVITETDIIEATRDFTRFDQMIQEAILTVFGLATAFFLFYFSPIGTALFG